MKPRNDNELLEAFAQSFSVLDDLTCPQDCSTPLAIVDATSSEDWKVRRWRPNRLAVPRTGMEVIRRVGPLPQLFESFAQSFAWLDVDLRICRFFANPPAVDYADLANAMFADPVLNQTLLPLRFVRFALAPSGSYDPICFDLSRFDGDDCPIVRLEHESILMHDRVGKPEVLFNSFRELLWSVIELGREVSEMNKGSK